MKLLILLSFFIKANSDLSSLRSFYEAAPKEEAKAKQMLVLAEKNSTVNFVFLGYTGAAKIILAKHTVNPYAKWNLFNEGKNILETAIKSDINNAELRYLRLTIQMNAPHFLGYKSNVNTDKEFLKKNSNMLNDKELKGLIENYLKSIK